ncbi:predicted protein [Naegleria gruberi]|uniref:Predicted protein n=1 Tax=Naegleria gruberi TaxID=5762 RepID=D2VXR0_NAEGR|nr:uncharacterized protein NAEGRDRAFT_53081 [Naegleria gruberi]EFC38336.1 predicted protein [Naegleria gruberi]|eukprot:XP_002671080.1 predicted protein [Naegleria gruberi strain NEG-M]
MDPQQPEEDTNLFEEILLRSVSTTVSSEPSTTSEYIYDHKDYKFKSDSDIPRLLLQRKIHFGSERYFPNICKRINPYSDVRFSPHKKLKSHSSLIYQMHLSHVIHDKKNGHRGCVNSVNWAPAEDVLKSNCYGGVDLNNLLISGSDDCHINIWDANKSKCLQRVPTPHTGNIFCVKWFPNTNLSTFISSAADGKIGIYRNGKHTQSIKEHNGMVHRVCIENGSSDIFISISQDGSCKLFDLRQPVHQHTTLLTLKEGSTGTKSVDINSIDMNPLDVNEFILGCDDQYVRLFDRRRILNNEPRNTYCPTNLITRNQEGTQYLFPTHVTGVRFNKHGNEILATYSGDNIYLFDKNGPDSKMKYNGHCNIRTVKEVNFFGEDSEFVISGSDCGNVFVWDKKTGCIVNIVKGDQHVVNCLSPHPYYPGVLATSGIEYNIKLFEMGKLDYFGDKKETKISNNIAYRVNNQSSDVSELVKENERKLREGHQSLILPASMVLNIMQLLSETETEEATNQPRVNRRQRRLRELLQFLGDMWQSDDDSDEEDESDEE